MYFWECQTFTLILHLFGYSKERGNFLFEKFKKFKLLIVLMMGIIDKSILKKKKNHSAFELNLFWNSFLLWLLDPSSHTPPNFGNQFGPTEPKSFVNIYFLFPYFFFFPFFFFYLFLFRPPLKKLAPTLFGLSFCLFFSLLARSISKSDGP